MRFYWVLCGSVPRLTRVMVARVVVAPNRAGGVRRLSYWFGQDIGVVDVKDPPLRTVDVVLHRVVAINASFSLLQDPGYDACDAERRHPVGADVGRPGGRARFLRSLGIWRR